MLSKDPKPEIRCQCGLTQADAFKLDSASARKVEKADSVTEQDRRNTHEDLIERTRRDALSGNIGAKHIDVLAPSGRLCRGNCGVEIAEEGNSRRRRKVRVMSQHKLWTGPATAEGLAFRTRALIRVVTAEGAVTDQQSTDLSGQIVDCWIWPEKGDIQDMSPSTPAMKPSKDMVAE